MFELARLPVGGEVLDVGTGTGDTALVAAELVGDTGRVDAVDASPAMVEAARLATEHLPQVLVTQADAADLPFDGPFDGAVSRNTLMLVDEPIAMLRELHRVLRPGSRAAVTVWSALRENPRLTVGVEALAAIGAPPPGPERTLTRVLSLGDPEALRALFEAAGFADVEVHQVAADADYESPEALLAEMREHPGTRDLFSPLDEADRARAWEFVENRLAGLSSLPGELLVAAGTRA